ncbi:hypothetical protein TrLO_g1826 [Triparma laevis f. longispina]|uniref:Uncharacterized protein n=1 Tax=Triparma laevis f. longispina TaxID=1714387 RepID=A0A9W7AB39_9STRA|nr:hypothetical protein TrLO_g1826 [Triparma laevis f. longispina]
MANLPPPPPVSASPSSSSSTTSDTTPIYSALSHVPLGNDTLLPSFLNEAPGAFHSKSIKGSYGKIVSMDYLVRKLCQFFMSGSLQVVDILTDLYYVYQLHTSSLYEGVSERTKTAALVFLILSCVLWILVSLSISWSFKENLGYSDLPASLKFTTLMSCTFLIAFDCPLFLISLPQRTVKVADITGTKDGGLSNSVFVLAFDDRREWKTSTHYGLLSHLPTFLFEDVPMFIINCQVSAEVNDATFESILCLLLSLGGILFKFKMIANWCSTGTGEKDV